ncbi:DUF1801 domain-containing protein [Klugiella xanthotipulae]|uniref:Uncharacterized protein YdhG (YjbR/CyaY superfamily) n=1 Tax=Klugiella xanthotipulae TaxID=244735 RepID=A0A543I5U1_9MICO|nr:DUF1801 domain-containing protein [Klugiella xanthotipulae]TQM65911.1 uncharacterized protein YdhG (YjbR/CyaY superfamily) [Klugiella xanthotipulae]
MQSSLSTIDDYLDALPTERQQPVERLLTVIRAQIDPRFEERMIYGMPGWVVPFSAYPHGYHADPALPVPFLNLASQKNHIAVYDMGLYADPDELSWFERAYAETGFKLNMGKSCIRFTNMSRIPFDLIGELAGRIGMDDYLARYDATRPVRTA